MNTLKVGVVGAGARAGLALYAENEINNAVITSVADPSPHASQRVIRQIKRDIPVIPSHLDWQPGEVDVAFVLSPDNTHEEIACTLIERKVAIYLEKPLAITTAGATRILETAYRTKTPLYVGHNMRHMSVVQIFKDIIQQGLIGDVKAIWCRHFVGHGGDFYFKDWHAEQRFVNGILLQKGAHDIDVMHYLAGSYTKRVVGMGGITIYNHIPHRADNSHILMQDWFDYHAWPPETQTNLHPHIDVEDLSMVMMEIENGVFATYQQCHYSPDYWRNYTVIGTKGRAENFGDGAGGTVKVWNQRGAYNPQPTLEFPITDENLGHLDADQKTVNEFFNFLRTGQPTQTSPLGAWYACVTGAEATYSLRHNNTARTITPPAPHIIQYFQALTTDNPTQPA